MQAGTFYSKLKELTKDLLFMSESDYPFEVLDWGTKSREEIERTILSFHESGSVLSEQDAAVFFDRQIRNYLDSGDPALADMAEKYRLLLEFIGQNHVSASLYKCGRIEVGVYLVVTLKDGAVMVLKTISVET